MFSLFEKKGYLGIDLGTSSIKIVEIKNENGVPVLSNYAIAKFSSPEVAQVAGGDKSPFTSSQHAKILGSVISRLGIKARKTYLSLPISSSFSTVMEMPLMSQRELEQSVPLEARKYIPVPVSEVLVDWSILEKVQKNSVEKYKIFIVALPKTLVQKYMDIAAQNKLNVEGMELETFSSARAIVAIEEKQPTMVIDIGANSTDVSISYQGMIELSHNFEISGSNFTYTISKGLGIDMKRAEELKNNVGLTGVGGEQELSSMVMPLVDAIVGEIRRTAGAYEQTFGRPVRKIVLSGGSAGLKGLVDYLVKQLGFEVSIANPFMRIKHDPRLEQKLREFGPELAVACGLALKGFSEGLK